MKDRIRSVAYGILLMVFVLGIPASLIPLGFAGTRFLFWPRAWEGADFWLPQLLALGLGIVLPIGCIAGIVLLLRSSTEPNIAGGFLFLSAISLMGAILFIPSVGLRVRCFLGLRDFSGADLSHIDLQGCSLSGVNLSRANLRSADLAEFDLSGANLAKADLRAADLSGANLHEADLSISNLSGADLRHADLSGADLFKASLREANLHGADLSEADLRQAWLHRAKLDTNTKLDPKWHLVWNIVNEGGAYRDLSLADLSGANLSGSDLSGSDLSGSDLSGANLVGTDLSEADLTGANLGRASLIGANLIGANLTAEQLDQAMNFEGATLPDGTVHK